MTVDTGLIDEVAIKFDTIDNKSNLGHEKILEETLELLEATSDLSDKKKEKVIHETADLWFHTMILLSNEEVKIEEVLAELKSRFGTSGHLEKASRGVSDEEK